MNFLVHFINFISVFNEHTGHTQAEMEDARDNGGEQGGADSHGF
jgi:hypothetical protein